MDIALGDGGGKVELYEIVSTFKSDSIHHFFYGQFLFSDGLYQFQNIWVVRV